MPSSEPEDAADLFGDDELFGDEDSAKSERERRLSDRELDSGDDEDRNDRASDHMDGEVAQVGPNDRDARIMDLSFPRQSIPNPNDGELHLLRIPKFIGLAPKEFDPSNFTVPTADHHSTTRSANFSANTVANTTIRYRKNYGTGKLESNTIMSRWSDGTVTLVIGDQTYELLEKPLAPELRDKDGKGYQDVLDSHQYVATPYVESQVLHIVGHMTNQFTVKPNKEIDDDALEKLQSSLSAATKGGHKRDNKDGIAIISSTQDPELQKKQAEMLEKEKLKAQRRRENAAARIEQQAGRVRSGMGGGLSIDDLERGASKFPGSRKKRTAPAKPQRARRKADYDSDDEDIPRGRNREDEYDLEDDFLAPSDEELEIDGGDESEEEIDEGSEDESPKMKKQKTSNAKANADAEGDSDVDAEGEIDDAIVPHELPAASEATASRSRRRVIIDDDED